MCLNKYSKVVIHVHFLSLNKFFENDTVIVEYSCTSYRERSIIKVVKNVKLKQFNGNIKTQLFTLFTANYR